nr:efflux RND transporter periplasmic adaptor subunit [Pseudoxanthomonas kalamensis]
MLALSACNGRGGPNVGSARAAAEAVPVTTLTLVEEPWNDVLSALGTVTAHESVTMTAKVSEVVQQVHFDSGDEVAAGATLITLSGNQQHAALQAAEAEAADAERQYNRGMELVRQQLIARATLDTQRATLDAARARVAQMRADIGDRSIRAPFAGTLGIRQVSPGALVTPGTVIATLDDISRVYVDFPVPEARLSNLQRDERLTATSVAWPGREFEGKVETIDARIDPDTRAVTVRGMFPNPGRELRPGMLMQVRLQLPQRQALVLPEIAVVQVGSDSFVWRARDDNTVERVDVRPGSRVSGRVAVDDGLRAGDRIVVDGTSKLRAGTLIVDESAAAKGVPPAVGDGQG